VNKDIGKRIRLLRKQLGLSQESLSDQLSISFQAISKWENGLSYPDIEMFPKLAEAFHVTIDYLLLGRSRNEVSFYNDLYDQSELLYSNEPSAMCYEVLKLKPPTKHIKLLEICCDEGNDAIFFARNGYDVTCIDLSEVGIENLKKKAKMLNVEIKASVADLLEYDLMEEYDIIYSHNALHYIPEHLRADIVENYQKHTNKDGVHALSVIVKKPFIQHQPDNEPSIYNWYSDELLSYYRDWKVVDIEEKINECNSSGIAHKHAVFRVITTKCVPKD